MDIADIVRFRMWNQHISRRPATDPAELVAAFGAVQAQDFGGAKWALGLRMDGTTEGEIERAFRDGHIIRTHILRPTWHFVAPADIRWMLELSAPRVKQAMAYGTRKLGLDQAIYERANQVMADALRGNQFTRTELGILLRDAGIDTGDQRLAYLVSNAELDAVICSGARRGKQFTYALFDERVPRTKKKDRDEALAELALRYFTSHGPATLKDFVWWSGLKVVDAKAGIGANSELEKIEVEGRTYWMGKAATLKKRSAPLATLIPVLDEYIIGYTDRSAVLDEAAQKQVVGGINILFAYMILIDGIVVGHWKRSFDGRAIRLDFQMLRPLTAAEKKALDEEVQRYGDYLCMPVMVRGTN